MDKIKEDIRMGNTSLGIEFGSTRIKAVLVGENNLPIASGMYDWENTLVDDVWTYDLDHVSVGLQVCYKKMVEDVRNKYDITIDRIGSIGISGMMHGYMVFDKDDKLLAPFRTWRNTMTEKASDELTNVFQYQIPQRWSVAHLYQSILNDYAHQKEMREQAWLQGTV